MTTSKPISAHAPDIIRFPDARPCDLDMTTYYHVNFPAYPSALADHLGNLDTTVIISEIAAGLRATESYRGILFPDLLIAFDANPAAAQARNGYLVPEQGKPPDFVLEVASESTALRDETVKRNAYANMGVREYWRFDHSGEFYRTPLSGDVLVDGQYQPVAIHRTEEGHYRGHSSALGLDLCWEAGQLRYWDPVGQSYLTSGLEERVARREAEAARREAEAARREAEAALREAEAARDEAEARARRLKEELRRRGNS